MIGQLRGHIVELSSTYVVLDVSGVGFYLNISASTAAELQAGAAQHADASVRLGVIDEQTIGQPEADRTTTNHTTTNHATTNHAEVDHIEASHTQVRLYTRLIVSEKALDLYGFTTRDARALFDQLLAISGVGPKLALAVLSSFSPRELARIVLEEDESRISQVPGVGKKTARRLLMELSDVFSKNQALRALLSNHGDVEPSGRFENTNAQVSGLSQIAKEAYEALHSYGFSDQEIKKASDGWQEAGIERVEDLLAYALKRLGGGR